MSRLTMRCQLLLHVRKAKCCCFLIKLVFHKWCAAHSRYPVLPDNSFEQSSLSRHLQLTVQVKQIAAFSAKCNS